MSPHAKTEASRLVGVSVTVCVCVCLFLQWFDDRFIAVVVRGYRFGLNVERARGRIVCPYP